VCAHTNVAVDNLVDGLRAHGVNAVRFGNVARVPADLQDMTVEAKLAEHPQFARLERLKDEKKRLLDDIARPKIAGKPKILIKEADISIGQGDKAAAHQHAQWPDLLPEKEHPL